MPSLILFLGTLLNLVWQLVCIHVLLGNLELFSTTMLTPSPQQSQGVHQEGGLLHCIEHHSRKQSSDSGTGCFALIYCVVWRVAFVLYLCNLQYFFCWQNVIDANIFPVLIEILQKAEFRTRKEAAWAIINATSGGTPAQMRYVCYWSSCLCVTLCQGPWQM